MTPGTTSTARATRSCCCIPGGADSRAWEANLPPLAERFRVFTPDRRGHGRTPDAGELTFDAMARDTIAFIEAVADGPVELAGCSDGASVGLLVAHLRPDLVKRLAFVCGVFHHTGWLPGSIELDEEADAFLGGWYAEVSPDGADHWPVVKQKLYEEHLTEPSLTPAQLAEIDVPTLVMIGDGDEVKIEHAVALYRAPARRAAGDRPGHLARAAGGEAGALQRDAARLLRLTGQPSRAGPGPPLRHHHRREGSLCPASAPRAARRSSASAAPRPCSRRAPRSPSARSCRTRPTARPRALSRPRT